MATWIDFKELRSKLKFADVIQHYGIEAKVKGDRAYALCPLPSHPTRSDGKKRTPSLSIHLTRSIFQCFGCGKSGNSLEFCSIMEGFDPSDPDQFRESAQTVSEVFGITANTSAKPAHRKAKTSVTESKAVEVAPTPNPPDPTLPVIVNATLEFTLKNLDPKHPYLLERGFTSDTIERFGLGFCGKGMMKDRIAIPLHSGKGELVGYAGRLVEDKAIDDEHPRYLFPGSREREGKRYEFRKSELLYGLNHLAEHVNDLIIVEGFASVWWLHQHGYGTAVAVMGSSASSQQIDLMLARLTEAGRLWIFTDEDDAGRDCAKSLLCNMASRRMVKWARSGEEGKQPTDFSADELEAMLWTL